MHFPLLIIRVPVLVPDGDLRRVLSLGVRKGKLQLLQHVPVAPEEVLVRQPRQDL
jgi:hypothetical protein